MNQALASLVNLVAAPMPTGTDVKHDPLDRQESIRWWWDDTAEGVPSRYAALSEQSRAELIARRNVQDPNNWHDKAAGLALDPFWMQGQKDIVSSYPAKRKALSDSIIRTRSILQNWAAETFAFSALAPMWLGPSASVYPLPSMLTPEGLVATWPGSNDTAQGKIPAVLRGELLVRTLRGVHEGRMDASRPVPWWLLGFSQAEYIAMLKDNPGLLPTYGQLAAAFG